VIFRPIGCALTIAFAFACGEGAEDRETAAPQTLSVAEVCAADGMILRDHAGPKAQILWRDGRRTFYCEAREAFAEQLNRIRSKRIVAFYVQDFADRAWASYPDHWIRAKDAVFVIGSEKRGAMGSSYVSFLDPAHADAFVAQYGGRQLRLDEFTPEVYAAAQQAHIERLIEEDGPAGSVVRVSRALMGASFEIAAWASSGRESATKTLLGEALNAVAKLEKRISSWDPESDTSALNRAAGQAPVAVGGDLRELIDLAASWSERTHGAFDVTVAPLLELWNRAASQDSLPEKTELMKELEKVGFEKIIAKDGTLFLSLSGMRLDLGAIGKGFAADRAAETLLAAGVANFIVEAGGDLIVRGSRGGAPWQVGIRDPRGAGVLAVSSISDRAIATSGDYEQLISIGGRHYSHILDPQSGTPASGLASVTVLSARAADSDALATALFVMGSEAGLEFVEQLAEVEALFITEEGSPVSSSGLRLDSERLVILE
jgi:thiamine biosynthesis lipoprotein